MTTSELIELLSKFPPDTRVLIVGELGWGKLLPEEVKYEKAYHIWHSDYNCNKTPYIDFSPRPNDGTYVRGRGQPDYVTKTIGEEFVLLLG